MAPPSGPRIRTGASVREARHAIRVCIAAAAVLLGHAVPAAGQQPAVVESEPPAFAGQDTGAASAPVIIAGDTLFRLYDRIGPFTAHERARAIERRLNDLIRDPSLDMANVTATAEPGAYDITIGELRIMTVTEADAAGAGLTLDAAARSHATAIRTVVEREMEATSVTNLVLGAVYALLATALLVVVLRLLSRLFPVVYRYIGIALPAQLPSIRVQKLELLSGAQIARVLLFIARMLRAVVTLVLLYLYTPLVLSFFPWTRRLSGEIVGWVMRPLTEVMRGMIGYLPSLFTILVIVVVTYYGIKLVKHFFLAIENGAIRFDGFYPEWARPTYKIIRFMIIALAVIMIWPYLPNSESDAFRGVAAFLGLLITFGSAGMIANVVGGVMLTYMRAFRVGDRVRIADTMGDVVGQDLLVTRVRTIKNVDITIPNSLVLGTHIINWSTTAESGGVTLHTAVSIGYDAPWRRVHELLIAAARATDDVLETPPPFVLQTSLGDFYVSYELNAWTARPERMTEIYSQLHANIQDRFNEAGVEIMSPHYGALRDGNATAIPQDYLPRDYQPSGFRFRRK